jgi:hypothetical protein
LVIKHSEGKLCNYSKFKTNFGLSLLRSQYNFCSGFEDMQVLRDIIDPAENVCSYFRNM